MDDEQLAAVFREAAAGGPPPRFEHADVVRAADRLRARRRAVLATTAVAVAVLVGGGGIAGSIALRSSTQTAAGAAPAAAPADSGAEAAAPRPEAARGGPAPPGPDAATCADRQDPALRSLVAQMLPAVADAPPAATTDVCLPAGQRYLSVELDGGVLTVAYLPPGTAVSVAPGMISATTRSGGTVLVPDRYPQLRDYLASRL